MTVINNIIIILIFVIITVIVMITITILSVRCDGRTDCEDGTDEADCKVFVTSVGYNKLLIPPADEEKLTIDINVEINAITAINEIENFFRVKSTFERIWCDRRLTYYNLKKTASQNKISILERESIWKSWLTYENVESTAKVMKTDGPDKMSIIPSNLSDFKYGDNTYLRNTKVFEGAKNAIIDVKHYTIDWLCDFHMEWYPFDTQSCTMQIINEEEAIDFRQTNITYLGPQELPQHTVHDVKMCCKTSPKGQLIVVEVILGQPLFTSFLTTTLPTGMLIMISQMATAFSSDYLDMIIQVNLTVFLVLATL